MAENWDLIAILHHLSERDRFFILFCLLIVVFASTQAARTVFQFKSSRPSASFNNKAARIKLDRLWRRNFLTVQSLRRLSHFSLLLTATMTSMDILSAALAFEMRNSHSELDVAGGPWELMIPTCLGLIAATSIYAMYGICEGLLLRHHAAWEYFYSNPPPSTEHAATPPTS